MDCKLRVCLAQMTSTNRHAGNIEFLEKAVRHAVQENCQLLALPEAAGMMNKNRVDAREQITSEADDPFIIACKKLAKSFKIWIHNGSTPILAGNGQFLNHTNLIDLSGKTVATYDKIHLFDVFLEGLPPTGESNRYNPGAEAVVSDTPWGPWGMSICYDLRFPHLYRDYAKSGATIMFIPSAFTVPTGEAHWEILLRARAIESGSFVIAVAQAGKHDDGRQTYGHSMVVDPWGKILLEMNGSKAGFGVVDLDLSLVEKVRSQIPALKNERPYTFVHKKLV
jgi:predicted amidohydrolase